MNSIERDVDFCEDGQHWTVTIGDAADREILDTFSTEEEAKRVALWHACHHHYLCYRQDAFGNRDLVPSPPRALVDLDPASP